MKQYRVTESGKSSCPKRNGHFLRFSDLFHVLIEAMGQTYTVEIQHAGTTHTVSVPEGQTILTAALDAGVDLPSSCCAGVCTTCAAQVLEGTVDQSEAMGLGPDIMNQGYALLCVAYPRSNLKIEAGKEDVVYHLQFGQFQS